MLEHAAKQQQDEKRNTRKRRADETAIKRSHSKLDESEDLPHLLAQWAQLKTPSYEKNCVFSITQLFTTASPVETFLALMEAIKGLSKEAEADVDSRKLKVCYKFVQRSDYDDEDEESKSPEAGGHPLSVSATIYKVNELKYCVDFVLKEGQRAAFLDHFQWLTQVSPLYSYNNSTLSE